jgi:hypothetical protein
MKDHLNFTARAILAMTIAVQIPSCIAPSTGRQEFVPSRVIVNTLKCDIAKYFAYEGQSGTRAFFVEGGPTIDATITLNAVDNQISGGGVSLDPSVLAFGSGSAGVGFGSGTALTQTTVRVMNLKFTTSSSDVSICEKAGADIMVNGIGVYSWLRDANEDLNLIARGEPLVLFDGFQFSTSFGVERTSSQSASFAFLPIKGNIDLTQSRSDVQKIEVKVTTKKAPISPPAGPNSQKNNSTPPNNNPSCPPGYTCPLGGHGSVFKLETS